MTRLTSLLAVALAAASALGQTTALAYQGQLKQNGLPASGAFDMTFRLWDAATNGQAVSSIIATQVSVSDGLFTAPLDFAQAPFEAGERRWLEISVNGSTLEPRQEVTPSPYSITAAGVVNNAVTTSKITDGAVTTAKIATDAVGAAKLANDSGSLAKVSAGIVQADPNSNIGIGTSTPVVKLDVAGDISSTRGGVVTGHRWHPLARMPLGFASGAWNNGISYTYSLPQEVPADAKEMLVYAWTYTGSVAVTGQGHFRIYTNDGPSDFSFYLYLYVYNQNAISFNSETFWLPVTMAREVRVGYDGISVPTNEVGLGIDLVGWR